MTTIHTLEADYGIYLNEAAIRKIMALNRRLHLAPQRPITIIEARDVREWPKKRSHPFEYIFIDLVYLDAKPAGIQLYSTLLWRAFPEPSSPARSRSNWRPA
jgi:hypothetical protein